VHEYKFLPRDLMPRSEGHIDGVESLFLENHLAELQVLKLPEWGKFDPDAGSAEHYAWWNDHGHRYRRDGL
jgi:hypothetical protein